MKAIFEHINELDQWEWDYYFEPTSHSLETPFSSQLTPTKFIKDYFKRGEKANALNLINIENGQIKKATHTSSIFFLGILLYKNTKLGNTSLFIKENEERYISFPFYWFLTCLYHDFGMVYERDKSLLEKLYDVDFLKQEFSIDECLLQQEIDDCHKILFSNIQKYFCYRRFVQKRIDHGILAGLFLYDRLVKNRKFKLQDNYKNLYWKEDLDKDYATVAAAIACHNIWLPDEKTVSDYVRYEMESLRNLDPISFEEFPLLYLLGIVDTIDPIKIYQDSPVNEQKILEYIDLKFTGDYSVTFKVDDSKLDPSKLLNKSKNLNGWLNVDLDPNSDSLTITLLK